MEAVLVKHEEMLPMAYSVNMETLFVVLMEHCRVLDGLANNMERYIIINIAEETSNNEPDRGPSRISCLYL
jgi:hypothetical protein